MPDQRFTPGDTEHVPFYSTYQTFDLVCYPSEHEGFGNQAIETVWARVPLVVLEYPDKRRGRPLPHADGEPIGVTPVDFEVASAALRVIVGPPETAGICAWEVVGPVDRA